MKTKYYLFEETIFYAVNGKTLSVSINEKKPFIKTYMTDVIGDDIRYYKIISEKEFEKAYKKCLLLIEFFKIDL